MGADADHNIELPKPGEEPHFLPHPVLDHLLEAVVALGAELWIERDRRRIMEQLLEDKGVLTRSEIEDFLPNEAQQAERAEAKNALVKRTLGSIAELGSS